MVSEGVGEHSSMNQSTKQTLHRRTCQSVCHTVAANATNCRRQNTLPRCVAVPAVRRACGYGCASGLCSWLLMVVGSCWLWLVGWGGVWCWRGGVFVGGGAFRLK